MTIPITYRTDDPTRWGTGLGVNLDGGQVDENFWNVTLAIQDLIDNPLAPIEIANITVSGTSMTFVMSDGSPIGPLELPFLSWVWRGDWQPTTVYNKLDWFNVVGVGIFLTVIGHVSGTVFDPAQTDPDSAENVLIQISEAQAAGIAGLADVLLTALADGQFLQWNGTDQRWENVDLAALGGSVATLTDVVLTALADNQLLRWHAASSKWINVTLGTMADQMANAVAITGGSITGMVAPVNPSDVATKAYADGIALPAIADGRAMINLAGVSAAPVAHTLTEWLDHVVSSARGTLLVRGSAGWAALDPGIAGTYLKAQGTGSDLAWDSPAGAGTVTSVASGPGLEGGPITGSGTLQLAAIAPARMVANISAGNAPPGEASIGAFLDTAIGSSRGMFLFRDATTWRALPPGANGQYLKTQGASLDPVWDSPAGNGTVISVGSGPGLQGGPITGSGVLSLDTIADRTFLANISGGVANPVSTTISAFLDAAFASTRGAILTRQSSAWVLLAPGTSGFVLTSAGAAADLLWQPGSASSLSGLADTVITSPANTDQLIFDSTSGKWKNQRPRYIVGAFAPGLLTASQKILYHKVSKAVTFPANFGAYLGHVSEAGGSANATGSTVIAVEKALTSTPNTFSGVGTITIASGGIAASFATTGAAVVSFNQGDILRLVAPGSADATFADFYSTLVGFES